MIRGTTPTLEFTLPFELVEIDKLWITFSQNNKEVFTVEKQDLVLGDKTISLKLSQKQTLLLSSNSMVNIQIRVVDTKGLAMASNIIKTPVQQILKDGEI